MTNNLSAIQQNMAKIQENFKIKLSVFAVFDRTTQQYLPPMFVPHDGLAERWFGEQVQTQNQIGKYPKEHDLVKLATWEPDTGKFANLDQPQTICNGGHVKRQIQLQQKLDEEAAKFTE